MQPGSDQDYRETPDVTRVHGAIKREHKEPETASVPVPFWLIGVVMFFTFGAAYYLGAFNGGFSGDVFNESQGAAAGSHGVGGAGAEAPAVEETLAQQGKKVFTQNCITCHQVDGKGLAGQYPPLAGSEYVQGPQRRVVMILLKGLQGPLEVEGKQFNGAMPAWGGSLSDKKIAAVLSYVRSEWGNTASEIKPEQVAVVRKDVAGRAEPWAQADIHDIKGDIETAGGAAPAKK